MHPLLDACMPADWRDFLSQRGYDCVRWLEVGDPRASDDEIMKWARDQRRVVLTHDLDFGRLLAFSGAQHPSVIQFRANDIRPHALGTIVLQALRTHRDLLAQGALVTVEPRRARVRVLPIARDSEATEPP